MRTRARKTRWLLASRMALVATALMSPSPIPLALRKLAKTSAASRARFIGSLPSLPVASSPSPMRTGR